VVCWRGAWSTRTNLKNKGLVNKGLLAAVLTIRKGRTVSVGRPPTKELGGLTAGYFYAITAAGLDHGTSTPSRTAAKRPKFRW